MAARGGDDFRFSAGVTGFSGKVSVIISIVAPRRSRVRANAPKSLRFKTLPDMDTSVGRTSNEPRHGPIRGRK